MMNKTQLKVSFSQLILLKYIILITNYALLFCIKLAPSIAQERLWQMISCFRSVSPSR